MAKKTRPSFDAPKASGSAQAGWVYRSEHEAADTPQPAAERALVRAEPAIEPRVAGRGRTMRAVDCALMPVALLLMTALAPVTWLRGKR